MDVENKNVIITLPNEDVKKSSKYIYKLVLFNNSMQAYYNYNVNAPGIINRKIYLLPGSSVQCDLVSTCLNNNHIVLAFTNMSQTVVV
jgi:hypothetical protein